VSIIRAKSVVDLLALDDAEAERNRLITQAIRQAIQASEYHAISYAEFMEIALYHPAYGYYTCANQVLGSAGDFTTAPELGAVFGRLLATKIARTLSSNDMPAKVYEFGAGTGKLATQILYELEQQDISIDEYTIIEISPSLRNKQRQTVQQYNSNDAKIVCWRDSLGAEQFEGIVVVNEVIDAMPVELFQFENGELLQGFVIISKDRLQLQFRKPLNTRFQRSVGRIDLPQFEGTYRSEWHCTAETWLQQLTDKMDAGSILIFDYGFPALEYYHPDRREGTLICHRRHHSLHDPLAYLGCQDITAHVNFTALADLAEGAGFGINGFTTLAGFMIDCGVNGSILSDLHQVEKRSVEKQLNTLTAPSEMRDLFKVLVLTKGIVPTTLGFGLLDHLHRL